MATSGGGGSSSAHHHHRAHNDDAMTSPHVAMCYVGGARTGVLPPVHRSVARYLLDAWESAGIQVDTFVHVSADEMQTHPHNREQWGKQWGKDDVRLPCLPDRAHLDSLLQALRPVHVQFIERNTCNAARNISAQYGLPMEPSAQADCCEGRLTRIWHATNKKQEKWGDFLQLFSMKACFAAADAYAERHRRQYSHYLKLRPDFAFFRPVPLLPLEGGPARLVSSAKWNAPASDHFFIMPAELKRSWWDAPNMSLSCETVTRHAYPIEYNLFPSPGLSKDMIHQNSSILGGLVRHPGNVECVDRGSRDGVKCSTASIDGLDELRKRGDASCTTGLPADMINVYQDAARAFGSNRKRVEVVETTYAAIASSEA